MSPAHQSRSRARSAGLRPGGFPRPSRRKQDDVRFMRRAFRLALRGQGFTSPNPCVGAVIVKNGRIIGEGWHRQAGAPHAEIEALRHAQSRGRAVAGATLYVTLEPCSTEGRTPPCTDAILKARLRRVVIAATDPNPRHRGRAFRILAKSGVRVSTGLLADEAGALNEPFNHWIVHRTPLVSLKAAMTLDGKIATASGESKWITGPPARAWAMQLRRKADAILVGINTVLLDNPKLTDRSELLGKGARSRRTKALRRIILDPRARTPLQANVVADASAHLTTIVVTRKAPARRVLALAKRVSVLTAPSRRGRIDLRWLLRKLGRENVTHLLVEGGGETNASFLEAGLVHRIYFFYAPLVLGGRNARKAVAGEGFRRLAQVPRLSNVQWEKIGRDLLLTARVDQRQRETARVKRET